MFGFVADAPEELLLSAMTRQARQAEERFSVDWNILTYEVLYTARVYYPQPAEYRDEVLGDRDRLVCIEAGRSDGWYRYSGQKGLVIGIDHFGDSAPYEVIAEHYGFTPAKVAEKIRGWRG